MCSSRFLVVLSAANASRVKTVAAFFVAVGLLISTAAAQVSNPGDFVLEYTGATGNMTLRFTGTGASGAGPVGMSSLTVLTLGDGSIGSLMPSGIPGVTAGQGGLNQALATLPSASFQTFNTGSTGGNGPYSEVSNQNIGTAWRTFSLSVPGVSDRMDLGNIAPTGWTSSVLSTIFLTDPDAYGAFNYGKFGYALTDGNPLVGAVVPEPTSMSTLAIGTLLGVWFRRRRVVRSEG